MDYEDEYERYEKKVGRRLIKVITKSLNGRLVSEGKVRNLIIRGMYDMRHKGWVDRDTDLPFKSFLHSSKPLLEAALVQSPIDFNNHLQQVKLSLYKTIDLVISAYKAGGVFTEVGGQPYDVWGKHGELHYSLWRAFLESAKEHFKSKADENSQWAYIAIELTYRESVREVVGECGKGGWCIFDSFEEAYEEPLKKALLLMRGDYPPWKSTAPITTSGADATPTPTTSGVSNH